MVESWLEGLEASQVVAAPMALCGHCHNVCLHHLAEVEMLNHMQQHPQLLQYQHNTLSNYAGPYRQV